MENFEFVTLVIQIEQCWSVRVSYTYRLSVEVLLLLTLMFLYFRLHEDEINMISIKF